MAKDTQFTLEEEGDRARIIEWLKAAQEQYDREEKLFSEDKARKIEWLKAAQFSEGIQCTSSATFMENSALTEK